jgi:hypothetical protein
VDFIKSYSVLENDIKSKLEVAAKMYVKNFTLGDIIEITGLSKEDLKRAGIV